MSNNPTLQSEKTRPIQAKLCRLLHPYSSYAATRKHVSIYTPRRKKAGAYGTPRNRSNETLIGPEMSRRKSLVFSLSLSLWNRRKSVARNIDARASSDPWFIQPRSRRVYKGWRRRGWYSDRFIRIRLGSARARACVCGLDRVQKSHCPFLFLSCARACAWEVPGEPVILVYIWRCACVRHAKMSVAWARYGDIYIFTTASDRINVRIIFYFSKKI